MNAEDDRDFSTVTQEDYVRTPGKHRVAPAIATLGGVILLVKVGQYRATALARTRLSRRCATELTNRGLPSQPLAQEHGLDLPLPGQPDTWILAHQQDMFVRDAGRLAADPFFGWALGGSSLRDLGLYGFSILNGSDVRSALRLMVERSRLETEAAQLAVYEQPSEATLAQTWLPNTVQAGAWLHQLLCTLTDLLGPEFKPRRLGLHVSEPALLAGFSERAGMMVDGLEPPVAFVTFERQLLDRPVHGADPVLAGVLTQCWQMESAQLDARHEAITRVAEAIVPLLANGTPTVAGLASVLGISRLELQRNLDLIGSSLPQIVDAVRSGLVLPLLAKPGMTLVSASKALDFTEPHALASAYERWWGRPIRTGHGRALPHG